MTEEPVLDDYWSAYFEDYLAQGKTVTQALKSVNGVHVQEENVDVDFRFLEQFPVVRSIWFDVAGTRFKNLDVVVGLPLLREVRVRTAHFAQHDLEMVTANPKISKLYLTGKLFVESLDFLNERPHIKLLSLDGVTGITAHDIARLRHITTLEISRRDESDYGVLAAMPKLRNLDIEMRESESLDNLDFLAAPKLICFETPVRALDDSALQLIPKKTQFLELKYPLRDVSILSNCLKLRAFRVDGSVEHDFSSIRDLPVVGVGIYFAKSQSGLDAISTQIKDVWPHAGISARIYWEDDEPEVVPETSQKRGFWARLFGR